MASGTQLVEVVPNFSTAESPAILEALATAFSTAHVLDVHPDAAHNRTVITAAGDPEALLTGCFDAVAVAVARLDLQRHRGVHPRVGVADVIPFIPLQGSDLDQCRVLAHRLGESIWRQLQVPVFFYAHAARHPERVSLAAIRAGRVTPDLGGAPHPRAGFVCVGARPPLVAYNLLLGHATYDDARLLARRLRQSAGGHAGIQALAFDLGNGRIQLSMNLVDLRAAPPTVALEAAQKLAQEGGHTVVAEEVVGLCPAAIAPVSASGRVLEARIAAAGATGGAATLRRLGGEERRLLAERLQAAASRLAQLGVAPPELLSAAEEAAAIRRVLAAADALAPEVGLLLDYAARELRRALSQPPPDLDRRIAALDAWLG